MNVWGVCAVAAGAKCQSPMCDLLIGRKDASTARYIHDALSGVLADRSGDRGSGAGATSPSAVHLFTLLPASADAARPRLCRHRTLQANHTPDWSAAANGSSSGGACVPETVTVTIADAPSPSPSHAHCRSGGVASAIQGAVQRSRPRHICCSGARPLVTAVSVPLSLSVPLRPPRRGEGTGTDTAAAAAACNAVDAGGC